MSTTGHIALFGEFWNELVNLNNAARGFGWSIRQVSSPTKADAGNGRTPLLAVLIHPRTLGMPWTDALELIQGVAPDVRVVICHGDDELDSEGEMTASGAFYTLLMPVDPRELQFLFTQLDNAVGVPSAAKRERFAVQLAGAA